MHIYTLTHTHNIYIYIYIYLDLWRISTYVSTILSFWLIVYTSSLLSILGMKRQLSKIESNPNNNNLTIWLPDRLKLDNQTLRHIVKECVEARGAVFASNNVCVCACSSWGENTEWHNCFNSHRHELKLNVWGKDTCLNDRQCNISPNTKVPSPT